MKNKVFKILSLTFLSILIYTSCNEDHINLQPLSPTEASYFKEEGDFTKGILGVYSKLNDYYWFGGGGWIHGFWALPGDDITTTGTNPFEIFGTLQSATGEVNTFYSISYQLINRANTMIQKLEEESGAIKTADLKNQLMGEALFLRAFGNFQLWNYFGTSPLIKERIQTSENTTAPNSVGNELLDQAIKDLTAAADLLPATWDKSNRGRVTKSSANGLLGKSLVFRGSASKNVADFTAALAALNKITDKKLLANFKDNFNSATENNEESLFEFQASQPDFDNVWLPNDFQAGGVGSTSCYWGYYENHWSLFGGARYVATQKLADAFDAEDPRLQYSVNKEDLSFLKYWSTGDIKTQSDVASANNPRILRYADVLLLKAEAILESGGSSSAAIDLINQVRTRARTMVPGGTFPKDYNNTETDKIKIFNWLNTERFIELAGEEGSRWLDLRRWHMAGKINLAGFDFGSVRSDVSFKVDKNLYYPLPLNEIDLNPNVVQNPGY